MDVVRFRHTIEIPAFPQQVWAVVGDFSRDPGWRARVVSMAPDPPGPAQPGTRVREEFRLLGSVHVTETVVTEVDGLSLRFAGGNDSAEVSGRRCVEPSGAGSLYSTELELRPHGVQRFFAPLTARMMRRGIERDLEALRVLVAADAVEARST